MIWDKSQQRAIDLALDKSVKTLFITGAGGSGKSKVTREIISQLTDLEIEVVALAPTHAAAKNLQCGMTIASFFKMAPELNIEAEKESDALSFTISDLQTEHHGRVLIFDEISMVGKSMFDKVIKHLEVDKIIFTGDPMQLDPVKDKVFDWRSLCEETVTLKNNYRTTDDSALKIVEHFRERGKLHRSANVLDRFKNVAYDPETYYIAFKNKTLSYMQEKLLGYSTARQGDVLLSFGASNDHIRVNRGGCPLQPKIGPYFVNNDLLVAMTNPVPYKHYDGLYQVVVRVYSDSTIPKHKNPNYPKEVVALVGDYDKYKAVLGNYFLKAKTVAQAMRKKYRITDTKRLKAAMNERDEKIWNRAWAEYMQMKGHPYARHQQFRTTYKSQGQSFQKTVIFWDELPDESHKYVALSRAIEKITIISKH